MRSPFPNRFGYSEWSGSIGDLGTLLPLAYALAIVNHYPLERLFLLWGAVYVATGWFFRVPVAVQPLKAMAVIAMAQGFETGLLSTAAVLYGILLLLLARTGALRAIERLFTPSIVRGIQLGVGLILVQKGIDLVLNNSLYLSHDLRYPLAQAIGATVLLLLLGYLQWGHGVQIAFPLLVVAIAISAATGVRVENTAVGEEVVELALPKPGLFIPALTLLIIPQLPLTLGNAVFAASDACRTFWPERAHKATPRALATSIGLSDLVIGLLGGFPICHGSGGMGAHARFGGKTGGTTIILGSFLITVAFIEPLRNALFLVPIPLLGVLLVLAGLGMAQLVARLNGAYSLGVASLVGLISFATRNLAVALLVGIAVEKVLWPVITRLAARMGVDYAERGR